MSKNALEGQMGSTRAVPHPPKQTYASINAYQRLARQTDKMKQTGIEAPLLGLVGEVGSLLSVLKKKGRDQAAFATYDDAIMEELGDVLWYFSIVASRAGLQLSALAQKMFRVMRDWDEVMDDDFGTFEDIQPDISTIHTTLSKSLVELAGRVGRLADDYRSKGFEANRDALSAHMVEILRCLVTAATVAEVSLDTAAQRNLEKTHDRWPIDPRYPPRCDAHMPANEQLPRKLAIYFEEHDADKEHGYVIQRCNGVIIGNRLTDNKTEQDDHRFHDVFHMAYATHLGWSPVLRELLRLQRKSDPRIFSNEDGQRARFIEEGITTFVFERGLDRGFFEKLDRVDYDMLKAVKQFVRGYEAGRRPSWQWERAILDGFKMFRMLKKHRKGTVVADLERHTMRWSPKARGYQTIFVERGQ